MGVELLSSFAFAFVASSHAWEKRKNLYVFNPFLVLLSNLINWPRLHKRVPSTACRPPAVFCAPDTRLRRRHRHPQTHRTIARPPRWPPQRPKRTTTILNIICSAKRHPRVRHHRRRKQEVQWDPRPLFFQFRPNKRRLGNDRSVRQAAEALRPNET